MKLNTRILIALAVNIVFIYFVIVALCCLIFPVRLGYASDTGADLHVVTSTSLLSDIVERIGDDKVDIVNIIPPAQCPGHFDCKPGDIQKLANADIFFMHGWQGEKFTQELIDSANNDTLVVSVVNVEGNWMTPGVQVTAFDTVVAEMCRVDAANCELYQDNVDKNKASIEKKGNELKAELEAYNLGNINVLCAEQQAGFVKWTGLNIVGTFGRPDSLTPQVVKDLVDLGRAENVTLVVDNLQSGQDAGKGVAEELGCKRVILSNFPGGFDNTDTWEKAIDQNVELILGTIEG
jgi:zinc transport system substrate-binding protein